MRYTNSANEQWPGHPAHFKTTALEFHELMEQVVRACLSALAQGIGIQPCQFLSLLDSRERRANTQQYYGSSIFRFFRYKNKVQNKEEPW